jgi:tripartite ATP-independent transporter DctM subunit
MNLTSSELLACALFVASIFVVFIGYPIAFSLAGVSVLIAAIGIGLHIFDGAILIGLADRYFGTMNNELLVAVPLFILMGNVLERSKIAEELIESMGALFGRFPGGIGYSVVIVGALLAASTGIVGATVMTLGLLSLPAMLRAGYDPKLASGIICASGTLGQIIPPSTVLIFIGHFLQSAHQSVQLSKGNMTPSPVSVGDLFAGAFFPGGVLVLLYLSWVAYQSYFYPERCPPMPSSGQGQLLDRRNVSRLMQSLFPALTLIVVVLGSIIAGIATPTESASVGAVGAALLAGLKKRINAEVIGRVALDTAKMSAMVFMILFGASLFSLVFRGLGGEDLVSSVLTNMPGGATGAVALVMIVVFVLGFFLETFEIIFIVLPICAPALLMLDVPPLWLGVLLGVNLQTSFLTPPFGFSLFCLRGVAPAEVTTKQIYAGAFPFVILQLIGVALIWVFPDIVTFLPELLADSPIPSSLAPDAPLVIEDSNIPQSE